MLETDIFFMNAEVVGDGDGLAAGAVVEEGGAVINLELFGAAERDFEAIGQIVGYMIAADGEDAGVFNNAPGINNIFGDAAADIDNEGAEFLLL